MASCHQSTQPLAIVTEGGHTYSCYGVNPTSRIAIRVCSHSRQPPVRHASQKPCQRAKLAQQHQHSSNTHANRTMTFQQHRRVCKLAMHASQATVTSTSTLDVTPEAAWQLWQAVREQRPLVQCITNFVSMDIMANVLLAAGCSPAMAHSIDEVEEFVSISSALLVNMGTLTGDWVGAMKLAAKQAVALGKPWVLDPVGCGATSPRTKACLQLLQCRPTVVRGNASEILALAGAAGNVKGVDSTASSESAIQAAQTLARQYNCIVAVSGATDYVTDGDQVIAVSNGVSLLPLITAAGCSVTALIAAFVAAAGKEKALVAAATALAVFGLAAEEGQKVAPRLGPASVRTGLIDMLHLMDEKTVLQGIRMSVL